MRQIVVLLSTFNGEKFLETQIESILNQNGQNKDFNLKILVRDDGSTDSTIGILKRQKRIDILPSFGKNIGVKKSFFELLSKSPVADFYFFSDQDDIWPPNKIQRFLEHYESSKIKDGIPVGIYSDLWISDENGISTGERMSYKYKWTKKPDYKFFAWNYRVTGAAFAINYDAKNLIQTVPVSWQSEINMHDSFIALLLSIVGQIIQIDEPLLFYRQHGGNLVGASNRKRGFFYRVKNVFKISDAMINDNLKIYKWLSVNKNKYYVAGTKLEYFDQIHKMVILSKWTKKIKIWKVISKDIIVSKIKLAVFREIFLTRKCFSRKKQR